MAKSDRKLVVANMEQKLMFLVEFEGQISDGMWENSGPRDHYQDWALRWENIDVAEEKGCIGRNFWVRKDNYSLASKELLDVIGERLLFNIRLYHANKNAYMMYVINFGSLQVGSLADFEYTKTSTDKYFVEKLENIYRMGFKDEDFETAQNDTTYTFVNLVNDIRVLRKAMKTYNG